VNAVTNLTRDLHTLTCDYFADCQGQTFRIHYGAAAPLDAVLVSATAYPARPGGRGQPARREPFSVIFRGPLTPVLPQRIYRIEHDTIGTFDLFIVPVGSDAGGMQYEAVFN
jgi:hypothetical protein